MIMMKRCTHHHTDDHDDENDADIFMMKMCCPSLGLTCSSLVVEVGQHLDTFFLDFRILGFRR